MVLLTAAVRGYHPAAFGEFLTYNPFERGEETMEYKLSAIVGVLGIIISVGLLATEVMA